MTSVVSIRSALRVSITAVFTALVAATTVVFSIYIPATRGYFNIGETMVYTTALLFGPFVGAIAGGVGSMIADLLLGFPHYAPGTLIIKAAEGAIVGYLGNRIYGLRAGSKLRISSTLIATIAAGLVGSIGATYYTGPAEVSIGLPSTGQTTVSVVVPFFFWLILAILIFVVITSLGFSRQPQFSLLTLAVLCGGAEMVLGYLLYQVGVLGFGWAALAEVPFNVGQASVGLVISLPLVRAVRKRMPRFWA